MSLDLNSILKDWPHENGTIKVRKITGLDGREKLQLRVDLGVLQMEVTGRPDTTPAQLRVASRIPPATRGSRDGKGRRLQTHARRMCRTSARRHPVLSSLLKFIS